MSADWYDHIQRYISGAITDAEAIALEQQLRLDASLRDYYLDAVNLDSALEITAETAEMSHRLPVSVAERALMPRQPRKTHFARRWLVAGAACVALWMIAGWLVQPPLVLEVLSVSGGERWLTENNAPRVLNVGDWLPAGRVEMIGEDSMLRLRFTDGTEVEFSGLTKADVINDGQKVIRMASGLLSANVKRQAPGGPMRVLTTSAVVDVLGTIFTLDAAVDEARLSVEEGSVKLRRLADQHVTEVVAEHSVVASLDSSAKLSPKRLVPPPQHWTINFDPQRERITGKILEKSAAGSNRVAAVAKLITDPMKDGPQMVHWRVQVAPARRESSALASLTKDAVLEVRWRSEREVVPQVVLRTFRARFGFRGGFAAKLETSSHPDAEGWRVSRVPTHSLKALKPDLDTSPQGLDLLAFEVTTLEENAGLEVASMSLQ